MQHIPDESGTIKIQGKTRLCSQRGITFGAYCMGGTDPDRPGKVNQDAYFFGKVGSTESGKYIDGNTIQFSGVMDGHGLKGHELTGYLRFRLAKIIEQNLSNFLLEGKNSGQGSSVPHILSSSYEEAQSDARYDTNVPAGRSGCTCVTVAVDGRNGTIHIANVGDSRAVLGYCAEERKWSAVALSCETTVDVPEERARVEGTGKARIDSAGNVFYGPIGIAMTRCLGNSIMGPAGITFSPVLSSFNLNVLVGKEYEEKDWFVVLGTDGLFDVMSNEEVVTFIGNRLLDSSHSVNFDDLANEGANCARKKWLAGLPIEVRVDDITLVIIANCFIN